MDGGGAYRLLQRITRGRHFPNTSSANVEICDSGICEAKYDTIFQE